MARLRGFGAWAWLFQAASGVFLAVLVPVHIIMTHLGVPAGLVGRELLMYDSVVARFSSPVVRIYYAFFISMGVMHGMNGVRALLLDLGLKPPHDGYVTWLTYGVGAAGIFYGLYVLLAI